MLTGKLRKLAVALTFAGFSIGGIFLNYFSIYFSHYKVLLMLILILNTIPYVYVFFLIETPFFYYNKKDVVNMFKCLVQICEINFPKHDLPKKIEEIRNALNYGTSKNVQKKK